MHTQPMSKSSKKHDVAIRSAVYTGCNCRRCRDLTDSVVNASTVDQRFSSHCFRYGIRTGTRGLETRGPRHECNWNLFPSNMEKFRGRTEGFVFWFPLMFLPGWSGSCGISTIGVLANGLPINPVDAGVGSVLTARTWRKTPRKMKSWRYVP